MSIAMLGSTQIISVMIFDGKPAEPELASKST
jgi:hypothetical protein